MIKSNQITELLATVKGTSFANIDYTTIVATSAANKAINIVKHTNANVQFFNNVKDYKNVYLNAVKRSASKIENNQNNIDSFELTPTWYTHSNDCFSLVNHNKTGAAYLFCIYNNAKSSYTIDGKQADKNTVAQYLTPSAAKALLNESNIIHNVKNNVDHDVIVRTISLDNINTIKAMGKVL